MGEKQNLLELAGRADRTQCTAQGYPHYIAPPCSSPGSRDSVGGIKDKIAKSPLQMQQATRISRNWLLRSIKGFECGLGNMPGAGAEFSPPNSAALSSLGRGVGGWSSFMKFVKVFAQRSLCRFEEEIHLQCPNFITVATITVTTYKRPSSNSNSAMCRGISNKPGACDNAV